jgi:hypothetical protein
VIEPSAGDHGTLAKHFADAVSGMRLWHCSHSCENFTGAFALAGRIAVDSMDLIANGWHKLCSFPYVGMNHGFLKTFVVSLIAIVLVYYGVAWAVLRCFHDEDETGAEAAVSVDGQGTLSPPVESTQKQISSAWVRIITPKHLPDRQRHHRLIF